MINTWEEARIITLEEAIQHCQEKANCTACGEQHKQLGEWLQELQWLHNIGISKEALRSLDFRKAVIQHINYYAYMDLQEEVEQYRERIEQLKHAEVRRFECKLPDGRICHFSDFIEFLEKDEVG